MIRRRAALAGLTALAPLLALTAVVTPVLPTPSASAATRQVADAEQADLPAEADLLSVSVTNGPRFLRATIRLRDLDPSRTSAYVVFSRPATPAVSYAVGTRSLKRGHRAVFARFDGDGPRTLACRGLQVRLVVAADAVRIRVPQRCLGADAGNQQVIGLTEGARGDAGDIDDTSSLRVRRG